MSPSLYITILTLCWYFSSYYSTFITLWIWSNMPLSTDMDCWGVLWIETIEKNSMLCCYRSIKPANLWPDSVFLNTPSSSIRHTINKMNTHDTGEDFIQEPAHSVLHFALLSLLMLLGGSFVGKAFSWELIFLDCLLWMCKRKPWRAMDSGCSVHFKRTSIITKLSRKRVILFSLIFSLFYYYPYVCGQ